MDLVMSDDFEKRQTVLNAGEHYRVLRDASSFPDGIGFKAGERLRLNSLGYSCYDDVWVYEFQTEHGELKPFWLNETDSIEQLTSTFSRKHGLGSIASTVLQRLPPRFLQEQNRHHRRQRGEADRVPQAGIDIAGDGDDREAGDGEEAADPAGADVVGQR